jgi:hypothetical protein
MTIRHMYKCLLGRRAMSDLENLEHAAGIVDDHSGEEKKKHSDGTTVSDVVSGLDVSDDVIGDALDLAGSVLGGVVDAGGTVLQGVVHVGGAVAEHAGDVAEAAVDAVGAVIGGLLDS